MKRVLFVDGCVRGAQSRTLRLAGYFLECLKEQQPEILVKHACLNELGLQPMNEKSLQERERTADFSDPRFAAARQFMEADEIVIAAPFWEGTFPAALHTYLEHVCVTGLTFSIDENGYHGHCRAQRVVFITTRGGIYEVGPAMADNHAFAFLKTVLGMLGISRLETVAAEGLDIVGCDVEEKLLQAEKQLEKLASLRA